MTQNTERKYYPPLVRSKIPRFVDIKNYFGRLLFGLWHTMLPHEMPRDPAQQLPNLQNNSKELYDVCSDMYRDSKERINKLEQKALNLLPYVSVLFGIVTFTFATVDKPFILNVVTVVIIFLLLSSIIISFRCTSIKCVKTVYVFDIYRIDNGDAKEDFDLARMSSSLVDCALFNNNVGNNVADMLNMAREYFKVALILGILGASVVIGLSYYQSRNATEAKEVSSIESLEMSIKSKFETLSARLAEIENGRRTEELEQVEGLLVDLKTRVDAIEERNRKNDVGRRVVTDSLPRTGDQSR